MAISVVNICNQALTLLGDKTVTEVFPPDDNKRARLCNVHYEGVRDALTREHQWNCSMVRIALPALSTTPLNVWSFEYQRSENPFDIRVWSVNEDPEVNIPTQPFVVEGRKILTDCNAPINVRFSRQLIPANMDALFEETLAAKLAARIAYAITGKLTVAEDMFKIYNDLRKSAMGVDGQEGTTFDIWEPTLNNVR